MTYKEIIDLVKEDAVNVSMAELDILPSKIIAICLYRYEHGYCCDEDIIIKHNPFGLKNPSTQEVKVFDSYYNGMINGVRDTFVMDNTNMEEVNILELGWSLKVYDLEFFRKYDSNMIELTEEEKTPFIDNYMVWNGKSSILETQSYDEAQRIASIDIANRRITNSVGKEIKIISSYNISFLSNSNDTRIKSLSGSPIEAGSAIICSGINMYESSISSKPQRLLNGTYYIYDGVLKNNRYQVCSKNTLEGKETIIPMGYIKEYDIK